MIETDDDTTETESYTIRLEAHAHILKNEIDM